MTDKHIGAIAAILYIAAGGWAILALYSAWMRDPYFVIVFSILAIVFILGGHNAWKQ